jgi:hypothetical protein
LKQAKSSRYFKYLPLKNCRALREPGNLLMVAQDKTESPFKEWYADTRGPTAAPLVDYGDWFDQPAYQDVDCQDSEFHVMKPT